MDDKLKEILSKIDNSWSKDLIIRYLYIKISSLVQRDLLYFCATEEEKYLQYKMGFINRFPYIVCSTLSDYFVELFKTFEIKAWKIIANSAKIPLFALVVEGDLGLYFLDPINDLFSNQYGLKPQNFAVVPHYKTLKSKCPNLTSVPKEYILELDQTIFKQEKVLYRDEMIKELSNHLTQRNSASSFFQISKADRVLLTQYKLQYFSDNLINLGEVKGPFERNKLYMYLFDNLLSRNENRQVKVYLGDQIGQKANVYIKINKDPEHFILYKEEKENDEYKLKLVK